MRNNLLEWIGQAENPDLLGGKGSSLDLLKKEGLPVPVGFCLTTLAFRKFVEDETVDKLPPEVASCLADALSKIHELGARLFAVRSSSSLEDSSSSSFAGQYDTVLAVGRDEVALSVVRCYSSLHSDRAKLYRETLNLPGNELMAVVIQELILAEASAVAFTMNPVTGSVKEIYINATNGLGPPLVSGKIDPDVFVVDKFSFEVLLSEVGTKKRILVVEDDRRVAVASEDSNLSLNNGQVVALARLCRRVDSVMGVPVDVEASWSNGKWWLLQARPIKT